MVRFLEMFRTFSFVAFVMVLGSVEKLMLVPETNFVDGMKIWRFW